MKGQRVQNVFSSKPQTLNQDYLTTLKYLLQNLHLNKKGAKYISLATARENKLKLKFEPKKPKFIGRRVFENIDLNLLAKFIDWTPFFQTWDLHGKYPAILKDKVVGESASQLFIEAKTMLN